MTNDELSKHLDGIRSKNGGILTPEAVVEDAKREDSPLHSHFEWDVHKAAQTHWLATARQIIRSVRVVVETNERRVEGFAYVRDPRAPHHTQGYCATVELRTDADAARSALVREFEIANAALERARLVAVSLGIADEVAATQQRIVGLIQTASNDAIALQKAAA